MNIQELDAFNLADAVKFHDHLNPRLWDQREHLRPEVHAKLREIARDFQEFLGVPDLEVKDITISGSNAAYNYTPHSDVDLHLVVDMPEARNSEVFRELFDAKKFQYNTEHDIRIGGYDVELYVQDATQQHHSQGIYSLLQNQWLRVPRRRRPNIDDISVKSKYEDVGHRIEAAIAAGDLARMDHVWNKLRAMRQQGLEREGEFAPENLVFKMLRNNGTIGNLKRARQAVRDRELSLEAAKKKNHKKKFRYGFGGYWAPGFSFSDSEGGGDGGGGESRVHESPDGVNPSTKMFLESDIDTVLEKFFRSCVDFMKIQDAPQMILHKDTKWSEGTGSFGQYDPDQNILHLATSGRHVLDILRTMAHELTHCKQNEKDRLPDNAGETGSWWEDEANAMAGRIMRNWAEQHPEMFKDIQLEESSGYIPTAAQARDPRFKTALTQDIKPGQTGREANKLALQTDAQGRPQLLRADGRVSMTEAQSAKTGIYQTDVLGAKAYHAKCMEPNCGWESKRFDRIKQAQAAAEKHAKSHFRQSVAEGSIKDLHIDLQDQQWDEIVGYVINGLKKNMDIGRMELNLYKYAGQEMFDVDQELQDRGFKDIADLADHIRQHDGRYVPPTDFNLGKGVAEGMPQPSQGQGRYRDLNEPLGPETPPTMPAGTVRVDVSDVYDWYKLGQHISNMKGLGRHDFGAGPPSSIISFGDEDTEHKFIKDLEATGLDVTDIDPRDPQQPKGMRPIKTDPTYNVDEDIVEQLRRELAEFDQQYVPEGLEVDVPNEDWLQDKIDYAKSKGRNSFGVPYMGATTAYSHDPVRVPVEILKRLPGMRGEQKAVRRNDLEAIMKIMKDTGKLPMLDSGKEYAPFINVAYDGSAWVNEGNHRIMAAAALGWEDLPVQISYFDGGERIKSGAMYPGKIDLGNIDEAAGAGVQRTLGGFPVKVLNIEQGSVDEAIKLDAPQQRISRDELQGYADRIKTGTKTKRDRFSPIIHGSNIRAITRDDGGTEWDLDDLAQQITKRPTKILGTNAKMEKSATEGEIIYDLTLPALSGIVVDEDTGDFVEITTCPGAGECQLYCYARKGGYVMFPASSMSAAQALNFLVNDPEGYMAMVDREVKSLKKRTDKHGIRLVVRWHDAGDFFSKQYLDLAYKVAEDNPDVKFYAYTKMGDVAVGSKPKNFIINFSTGSQSREVKKVQVHKRAGNVVKDAITVPKDMFRDLFVTDARGKYVKDEKGRTQIKNTQAWDQFRQQLATKYNIDPDTIITYDQMLDIPEGPQPKWNVVIFPAGHGDRAANRLDVINSFLMFH